MIIIGIDPGLEGAIAYLVEGHRLIESSIRVVDTPTTKDGTHRVYLPQEMRRLLAEPTQGLRCHVFIEKVHSMPKQGVASSFNFGVGFGLWQGLIAGLGLPVTFVTPQRWMKDMMAGMQRGKDSSIVRAQELFPDAPLSRKKDHGRADALLIAEWGRRQLGA